MFVPRRIGDNPRKAAVSLIGTGLSDYDVSRRTGVSRSTVQRWRKRGAPRGADNRCCASWRPAKPIAYSYLLGIYLGDGYLSKATKSPVLEISADIRSLFCESCELVGVRWTRSSIKNISVADRRSVEILDGFIGPKS